MKKLFLITALLSLAFVGSASAVVGWAGNVWPNSGSSVTPTGPVDCYVQVWKGGVTDLPGQGVGLEVYVDLTNNIGGSMLGVACVYMADNGANDEYTVQIPQSMLLGAATVTAQFMVHDLEDESWFYDIGDQAGNAAPQTYNVVAVLPNDVDVTFTVCMSGEAFTGGPCVVGSAAEINSWGPGVVMNSLGGDLFEVTVTFLAGGNPNFEYKFQKDGCSAWESVGNRPVTLPIDGTPAVVLATDSWNNLPMGCGMGNNLTEDKTICFQVCLDGVDTTGAVCIVGNVPELDGWGAGISTTMVGPGLYQACVVFPAGSPYPINLEYKSKKDDCNTWEGGGNNLFTVDDSIASETTLTHTWEGGAGQCAPVGNEDSTWGSLKAQYR